MYQVKQIGNKTVGIAMTGRGWRVDTYTVNKNKVRTFQSKDVSTLAQAKKEFTNQKRMVTGQPAYKKPEPKPQYSLLWGGEPVSNTLSSGSKMKPRPIPEFSLLYGQQPKKRNPIYYGQQRTHIRGW